MRKEEIRRRILVERDRLTSQDLQEKSYAILEKLFRLEEMQGMPAVMFYASFRSEVQTISGIEKSLANGIRVALPLSISDEKLLRPYLIKDPSRDLRPGFCSIPEPIVSRTELVDPGKLDTVIVPGSVFDLCGGRLGYGGGFYDRFLENQAQRAFRVALAFELQIVNEEISLEAHDQLMDCLVTEKRVLRFVGNRD